jgi:hypothetical protein
MRLRRRKNNLTCKIFALFTSGFRYLSRRFFSNLFLVAVELDVVSGETRSGESLLPASMSPDSNHNELVETPEELRKRLNGVHIEAAVPDEVLNGLSMHSPPKMLKTGGSAEDAPNDLISVKAAVGEQSEDDEKIKEYLQRSDTAVIYPEPVGHSENGECYVNISRALGTGHRL